MTTLIEAIVSRLRNKMPDGQHPTLCEDRVFGALSVNDVERDFEAQRPFMVVAPITEAGEAINPDSGMIYGEFRIIRNFSFAVVFDRPEQEDWTGIGVAALAEVVRDQLLDVFLSWTDACPIEQIRYVGMERPVSMPGRSVILYTFAFTEVFDADAARASVYNACGDTDADGGIEMRVTAFGTVTRINPDRPPRPDCGD